MIGSVLLALLAAGDVAAQALFPAAHDPLAGSRVFGAKGCVRCHAVNGVGGKIGPDLGRIARPRSFYDLAAALWNHTGGMAERMRQHGIARPQLDRTEMGDLVAFLFTVDYFDPPGDAARGSRLFTDKRCVVCHQVAGRGGVVGPGLDVAAAYDSPLYLAAEMWNHGPRMADAMRARGIVRPTFQGSELRDLIAFVKSTSTRRRDAGLVVLPGRAAEGRRLFIEHRCALCHAGEGRSAPDLAERAASRGPSDFAAAMWNKAPAMAEAMKQRGISLPRLAPAEVADLVAYLYSLRYFARSGDAGNGVKVAAAKGCFGCHALRGERGKPASDLARAQGLDTPAAVMAALWNHSFITAADRRTPWPTLTSDEMGDLMAFLASLRLRTR